MFTLLKIGNQASRIAERKKITAGLLIFVSGILILLGRPDIINETKLAGLVKLIPPVRDMATSPIAQEILKGQLTDTREAESVSKPAPDNSDRITIPVINVFAPIVTAETFDAARLHDLLDGGALIYPGSSGFGNNGQTILLGHSAPADWPNIKHDTMFSRIVELVAGDKIIVKYKNKTYDYAVIRTRIIEKGAADDSARQAGGILILVTCWPPGRDLERVAVEAALISFH